MLPLKDKETHKSWSDFNGNHLKVQENQLKHRRTGRHGRSQLAEEDTLDSAKKQKDCTRGTEAGVEENYQYFNTLEENRSIA